MAAESVSRAAALDQKYESDDKQNARDNANNSCAVHAGVSFLPDSGKAFQSRELRCRLNSDTP
jgi:hypothetical protein